MRRRCSILLCLLLLALPAYGQWKTLKNDNFVLFYPAGREALALDAFQALELVRPRAEKLTGNQTGRMPVVLSEMGIVPFGFTDLSFRRIHLFNYPDSTGELSYTPSWWAQVGIHEYIHYLHLSKSSGIPGLLALLFGNNMSANVYSPDWLSEGLAVYGESELLDYAGRLNEGYYSGYIAALAAESRLPSLVEASFGVADFPGGNVPFLYGGAFIAYLALEYGEGSLASFLESYGATPLAYLSPLLPGLGLDRSARRIYGKSFPGLWRDWQAYETNRSSYPEKSFPLSRRGFNRSGWSVDNFLAADGKLYYQHSEPRKVAAQKQIRVRQLIARDLATGKERTLFRSTAGFQGPMRLQSGQLYFATKEIRPGFANRDFNSYGYTARLYRLDLDTGRKKLLLTDRVRSFTVLPGGEIIYSRDREEAFGSEVYRLREGERPQLLYRSDYLLGDIISGDGALYLSARKDWQNFSLYALPLPGLRAALDHLRDENPPPLDPALLELKVLVETPFQESDLYLDGQRLFFSANYGGVRSIYSFDLAERRLFRLTGAAYARLPVFQDDGLFYLGLSPGGFDIYRVPALFEPVDIPSQPLPEPPADFPSIEELTRGGYGDNLLTLTPKVLYPLFGLDSSNWGISVGAGLLGVSALGDIRYTLNTLYNFPSKRSLSILI